MAENEDVVAQLYAASPEGFVAERAKLARKLRDEGRAEEAREVASLRKPTLPASLANRLAHERPRDVTALLDSAEHLAAAHGSGEGEKLRRAQSELADQVRNLVALASEITERPVSESVGQRLAETLRAAATDPDTSPLLRRGVLQEEVETSGFEALAGVKLAPAKHVTTSSKETSRKRASADDPRKEQLRADLAAAKRDLRSAEATLTAAEREAARARRRVSDLEARLQKLS